MLTNFVAIWAKSIMFFFCRHRSGFSRKTVTFSECIRQNPNTFLPENAVRNLSSEICENAKNNCQNNPIYTPVWHCLWNAG